MDPKKVSDLDPKLKEVYERVMGTKVPNSQNAPAQQTPEPKTPPSSPAPAAPAQQTPTSKTTTSQPMAGNVQVFTAKGGTVAASKQVDEKKGNSPVLAIVLGIAGLIFFAIYGLFWLRFFNVSLPFTLPF